MCKKSEKNKKREIDDRNYKLMELEESLSVYNKIAINGDFGSGKTYLKDMLENNNKERKRHARDIIIEINAYQYKGTLIEEFTNKIKQARPKI
jgi:predicted NACHT family NTPase